jgi:hypothetical protein
METQTCESNGLKYNDPRLVPVKDAIADVVRELDSIDCMMRIDEKWYRVNVAPSEDEPSSEPRGIRGTVIPQGGYSFALSGKHVSVDCLVADESMQLTGYKVDCASKQLCKVDFDEIIDLQEVRRKGIEQGSFSRRDINAWT